MQLGLDLHLVVSCKFRDADTALFVRLITISLQWHTPSNHVVVSACCVHGLRQRKGLTGWSSARSAPKPKIFPLSISLRLLGIFLSTGTGAVAAAK